MDTSSLSYPFIECLLNAYLQRDAEMSHRLKQYHDRIIRVHITSFQWIFYITIDQTRIKMLKAFEGPIDASLKSDIFTLTQAALNDKPTLSQSLELTGDVTLIQAITDIFKAVDVDWEGFVAHYTGDALAHEMGKAVSCFKRFHEKLWDTGKLNLKAYLQEDSNLTVHPYAVEDYCKDVDYFRDAIERLTARLNRIKTYV